ncbi:MAG TPA: hypothetical protein VJ761_09555 [Ktedonobacteraceae bacterium]|nr:hypothetical protein [Ktedonobacteraceae bacterium]
MSMNRSLRRASWYITPILSIVLSLPTLLSCLSFLVLVIYEVTIRDMKGTLLLSIWNRLPSPILGWLVLSIVFGPIFACVICAGQLARSQQEAALVNGTGGQVRRLTRNVLLLAALSLCFLVISVGVAFGIRGRT